MLKVKRFYFLFVIFVAGISMNNIVFAADAPLSLNDARKYFGNPYNIFSRKWMDNQTQLQKSVEIIGRVARFKPKFDARYKLERKYSPSNSGLIRSAVSVFGNYCAFQQGFLVNDFQDKLFCLKDERAFAYVSWGSEWQGYGERDSDSDDNQLILTTRFVMLSDIYANDAYREAVQYKAATHIIFSD